jgi:dCMP deaminase|tara:strand:+ start:1593 stop:2033 length:441 start_codon:yes stop_codon:yes gene_type:complete
MTNKWNKRYLDLARNIAQWSKDPSTQCGAVVIGQSGQVLSQGYNGFPRGMDDDEELYNDRNSKYDRIVHAEMNAIYNCAHSGVSLNGATLYVHGLPCCHECSKAIIQVGIKEVVMSESNNIRWNDSCSKGMDFLEEAGIKITYLTN